MPAPALSAVRVPFYLSPSDLPNLTPGPPPSPPQLTPEAQDLNAHGAGGAAQFITNVFLELVAFERRYFWLHVSESPGLVAGPSTTPFGAAALSLPFLTYPSCATTTLGGGGGMPVPAGATSFAETLSRRLTDRLRQEFQIDAGVYVNCAVNGERAELVLGGETGSHVRSAAAFGGIVFREAVRLIRAQVEKSKEEEEEEKKKGRGGAATESAQGAAPSSSIAVE